MTHAPPGRQLDCLRRSSGMLQLHAAKGASISLIKDTTCRIRACSTRLRLSKPININSRRAGPALLFSSSKPKPSQLQLRKGALLRRTPRPCLAQAPLPLPISLASRIGAAAPFFKCPLAGPLVSRRRAKGLERRAANLPPDDQRRMASV